MLLHTIIFKNFIVILSKSICQEKDVDIHTVAPNRCGAERFRRPLAGVHFMLVS